MFSTFTVVIGLALLAIGYLICNVVHRLWPNEAKMIDAFGTKFGTQAKDEAARLVAKSKAYAASFDD